MGLVQSNATPTSKVKTVWYAGADVLQKGYALAYDVAATVAATDPKTRLGNQVVKPATANLFAFAGLVADGSAGKQGPCFVDIIEPEPGAFADAFMNINATAFTTALGLVNGSYALGAFADATLNFGLVGIATVTQDTSGAAALVASGMKFKN